MQFNLIYFETFSMVQVQDNGFGDGGVMTLEDLRSGDEVRQTGKPM